MCKLNTEDIETGCQTPSNNKMMQNDAVDDQNDKFFNTYEDFKELNDDSTHNDITYESGEIRNIPDILDLVYIKLEIPVPILKRFYQHFTEKAKESPVSFNNYVSRILDDHISQSTLENNLNSLVFDGKVPRRDVLEKLYDIATELEERSTFPEIRKDTLKMLIQDVFRRTYWNPDSRTLRKYVKCLSDYVALTKSSASSPFYYNFKTLKETIRIKLNQY